MKDSHKKIHVKYMDFDCNILVIADHFLKVGAS